MSPCAYKGSREATNPKAAPGMRYFKRAFLISRLKGADRPIPNPVSLIIVLIPDIAVLRLIVSEGRPEIDVKLSVDFIGIGRGLVEQDDNSPKWIPIPIFLIPVLPRMQQRKVFGPARQFPKMRRRVLAPYYRRIELVRRSGIRIAPIDHRDGQDVLPSVGRFRRNYRARGAGELHPLRQVQRIGPERFGVARRHARIPPKKGGLRRSERCER